MTLYRDEMTGFRKKEPVLQRAKRTISPGDLIPKPKVDLKADSSQVRRLALKQAVLEWTYSNPELLAQFILYGLPSSDRVIYSRE